MNNGDKMLFLTSWPNGELRPVTLIEKSPYLKGGWYIRKESGGSDTTTAEFLYAIPKTISKTISDLTAKVAELEKALASLVGHNLPTRYAHDDDEAGECPYCSERSHLPHKKDCEARLAEELLDLDEILNTVLDAVLDDLHRYGSD
jgi:hypothetical protein